MNIAILDGRFDFPHRDHVVIADRLLKLYFLTKFVRCLFFSIPLIKIYLRRKKLEMTDYLENAGIKIQ